MELNSVINYCHYVDLGKYFRCMLLWVMKNTNELIKTEVMKMHVN